MEGNFQPSSFIPKKPLDSAPQKKTRRNISIFMILAWIVFIASLLAGGGAFLYEKFLVSQVEAKQQELREMRANLQTDVIEDLQLLSHRLKVGEELLKQHTLVTPFFAYLEDSTLRSVQFTNFSLVRTSEGYRANFSGETDSYTSVALQAQSLSEERAFHNPILSSFNLTPDGDVSFSVSLSVDPRVTLYSTYITQ